MVDSPASHVRFREGKTKLIQTQWEVLKWQCHLHSDMGQKKTTMKNLPGVVRRGDVGCNGCNGCFCFCCCCCCKGEGRGLDSQMIITVHNLEVS